MRDDIDYNIKFCELIEKQPSLYDFNRPDYCIRDVQDKIWQTIATKLEETAIDCKERWKNIRGRYSKYNKKRSESADPSIKPMKQYYLAPYLHFLDNFLKTRQPRIKKRKMIEDTDLTISDDEDDCESLSKIAFVHESEDPLSHSTPPTTFVSSTINPSQSSTKYVNETSFDYFGETSFDSDVAFLHSVLPDMKAMKNDQKRKFKIGILKLAGEILEESSFTYATNSSASWTSHNKEEIITTVDESIM